MISRLGVNIDHIATLRQLRGTPYPNILEAAQLAEQGGASQITVHLREDRRHIQVDDVKLLRRELKIPLNLEMAATPAMMKFARQIHPEWVCLVPEKRAEVTTEGGLSLVKYQKKISGVIAELKKVGIKVSCFVEPILQTVKMSQKLGADAVEFHTGRYCLATQGEEGGTQSNKKILFELERLKKAAELAQRIGLHSHAGHGLDYKNVRKLAELENPDRTPLIEEYNIGHSIVCRAAIVGLERAVREMASSILAP